TTANRSHDTLDIAKLKELSDTRRYFFSFYFQAEDGIRDGHVTGVQTCALPILIEPAMKATPPRNISASHTSAAASRLSTRPVMEIGRGRVGKECRSWWAP